MTDAFATPDTPRPTTLAEALAATRLVPEARALCDSLEWGEPLRREFEEAERHLLARGITSTIVVFGSARIRAFDQSQQDPDPQRRAREDHWYQSARQFAKIASERGGALDGSSGERINVIATGGGPGIMEAANRGAHEAGAPSIGLNIKLPHEQRANRYVTPDLSLSFQFFALRKLHFALRAHAFVIFPGGFGTLDELFEMLALVQTGKMRRVPVVLFDQEFWRRLIDFEWLVHHRMIDADDPAEFNYADTAEDVWRILMMRGLSIGSAR